MIQPPVISFKSKLIWTGTRKPSCTEGSSTRKRGIIFATVTNAKNPTTNMLRAELSPTRMSPCSRRCERGCVKLWARKPIILWLKATIITTFHNVALAFMATPNARRSLQFDSVQTVPWIIIGFTGMLLLGTLSISILLILLSCDSSGVKLNLHNGDMYIMSEKATGNDWKKRNTPTLRHSAGASKFRKL